MGFIFTLLISLSFDVHAQSNSGAQQEGGASNTQTASSVLMGTAMIAGGIALIYMGVTHEVEAGKSYASGDIPLGAALMSMAGAKFAGGVLLSGMGAISLAQAAEDAGASSKADEIAGLTSNIPKFDLNGNPIPDEFETGSSIFSDTNQQKDYDNALATLKKNGISYDRSTGIVTTPQGNFNASDLKKGTIDDFKALGLSDEAAKYAKDGLNQAIAEAGSPGGAASISRKIAKAKDTEVKGEKEGGDGNGLAGLAAVAGVGGGGSKGSSSGFKPGGQPLFGRKLKKSKLAGLGKKKKSKMYYGTPVGGKNGDIFQQVTAVYVRKSSIHAFIPHP